MVQVGGSLIEEIVALLEDGRWHTLREIREALALSEGELGRVVAFFKQFGFIDMDNKGKRAKLSSAFLELPA